MSKANHCLQIGDKEEKQNHRLPGAEAQEQKALQESELGEEVVTPN